MLLNVLCFRSDYNRVQGVKARVWHFNRPICETDSEDREQDSEEGQVTGD